MIDIKGNIKFVNRYTGNCLQPDGYGPGANLVERKFNDQNHNFDEFEANDGHSPEKDLMDKEKIRLINETLLMLTDESPSDAYWVKLHLEAFWHNGLNHAYPYSDA